MKKYFEKAALQYIKDSCGDISQEEIDKKLPSIIEKIIKSSVCLYDTDGKYIKQISLRHAKGLVARGTARLLWQLPAAIQYNREKNPDYGHYEMQTPSGEKLCHCGQKKAIWYMANNLVELLEANIIRLKFEPKFITYDEKETWCVVCGSRQQLTKHHIVPLCYRQYLPVAFKFNQDVVRCCEPCHRKYENKAWIFHKQISDHYKVHANHLNKNNIIMFKLSNAIKTRNIPEQRKKEMLDKLKLFFPKNTKEEEIIDYALKLDTRSNISYGEQIIKKVKNENGIQNFIEGWRMHFLEHANPQFMLESWNIKK
jgi:hypothetical protein